MNQQRIQSTRGARAPEPQVWVSTGGATLTLRAVRSSDADLFVKLAREVSPGAAYFRFGRFKVDDLDFDQIHSICDPDPARMLHIVAEACEHGQVSLAGNVRLEIDEASREAEFVILVADRWHRHGLGANLLRMLLQQAKERGLTEITARVLPSNWPMQRFLGSMGFELLDKNPSDGLKYRFDLTKHR